jgi:hypothetical protein
MSTSNRIIKPGYESYQLVVAARQFSLGQVPPHFFLHHLTESRADLPDLVTSQKCYSLFDDLHIPIPCRLIVYLFNQRLRDLVVNVEGSHVSESFRTGATANQC